MALSPEIQAKVIIWRQKAVEGTLTTEEMKEAIQVLRQGRIAASAASDASRRTRARKEVKSADELLKELGGL